MAKSFLKFREVRDTGKTKVWSVTNNNDIVLADIKWYAPWRRYVADFNYGSTIMDSHCLKEITSFIDIEMNKRKKS